MKTPYKPTKQEEFWCNKCDSDAVNSEKPATGNFYVQFGHCYDPKTSRYSGEYVGVMYAICADCLEKEKP